VRIEPLALDETLNRLTQRLLESRSPSGHWEGRLSSSALSTATATVALWMARRAGLKVESPPLLEPLISGGVHWLRRNQNPDGGWGDTASSPSNQSTTSLVWAALSLAREVGPEEDGTLRAAEVWLSRKAGSLEPSLIAAAIARAYGEDRTFSVPILAFLALAGCLGEPEVGWTQVPQLPFELAALPHSWFRWLRLPVVSYALPALIALGKARHHHAPSRNPLARLIRAGTGGRALGVLARIQPSSGGFLEAVPLTSFVTASLLSMGLKSHPSVQAGIGFLAETARPDGSWPIDRDLATWVTTLSVASLAAGGRLAQLLPERERQQLGDWLAGQQHRGLHPYSGAAPGGWGWTDRPGGVPDADDTAGALVALRHLDLPGPGLPEAVRDGIGWLLQLQNRDGGIPTFCRGWGRLPFDRSSPDLTAHAVLAWAAWRDRLPLRLLSRAERALARALAYLAREKRPDGSWVALWFGNQAAPREENPTYGTARVVQALARLAPIGLPAVPQLARHGVEWLFSAQNPDGGWGGTRGVGSTIEETGLALEALAVAAQAEKPLEQALQRGTAWLLQTTDLGRITPSSPIGLYFAKLWYSEELYPLILACGALAEVRSRLGLAASTGKTTSCGSPAGLR
jgi:squalene-hopene/tetraprenyl-beta-curcumene cyclase